jgi:DNA polymerase I
MIKKNDTSQKEILVLLDAHAILHRAYHALPDFATSKGEPTGALYGLSTMLMKIIAELNPDHIAACYDVPKPTYRHDAYADYKAGRKEIDQELISQIIRSRDVFEAFGIPIYEKEGFEADDILGTITWSLKANSEVEIIIASGDMDTLQLVDKERVKVYTLKKGIKDTVIYDERAVEDRFGFSPEYLPDFKALRGDPSDNIIGIKGIGEKTAGMIIQSFSSIENLYAELETNENKLKDLGLTERIVSLIKNGKEEAVFSKMLAKIRTDAPIDFSLPSQSWKETFDWNKVEKLFMDLEFRSLARRLQNERGKEKDEQHNDAKDHKEVDQKGSEEVFVALWLLNSAITEPSLEDVYHYANTRSYEEAREIILNDIREKKLEKVYREIELPIMPVIQKMEDRGIKINSSYFAELSKKYRTELESIQNKIWKEAGEEFNINSPKQLGEILFNKLNLKVKGIRKTPTGTISTRESELEKLKDSHSVVALILRHRHIQKLLSTYIDVIPKMTDSDGRLRARFLQTGTTTGRMSSNRPNLQNIPIKTELGRNIRKGFVAEKDYILAAFDYSQIELRIAAFLSGDEKLIDTFKKGEDVHRRVAAEVFSVSPDDVDDEMRRQAKVINFGILYGMGKNALQSNLGTGRKEAEQFYNEYFRNFSGLADYLERMKKETAKKGYTETFFGRRRYLPDISSQAPYLRAAAERMAVNAPIQGTQADILKIAMRRIDDYITDNGIDDDVRLLLQVHDELVFEIKESIKDGVMENIRKIMESILSPPETSGISLKVGISVGETWGDMETYNESERKSS